MPAGIVIRGGTVIDGSGAPGRAADVAIADGVIREIGPNLRGERELDASGCVVAPGFIDIRRSLEGGCPVVRSSYGGAGVADRALDWVGHIVYLDAATPVRA